MRKGQPRGWPPVRLKQLNRDGSGEGSNSRPWGYESSAWNDAIVATTGCRLLEVGRPFAFQARPVAVGITLLPPDGGVANRIPILVARHDAGQQPALQRVLPLLLVRAAAQAVPSLVGALRGGVPDGGEAGLALVLVGVEVGELPALLLVLVRQLLVLRRGEERLRLGAAARADLLVQRRVEAFAAERDDRDVLRLPGAGGQLVELLLVLGRRQAVVGRARGAAVLDEDRRVANLVADRVAVHLLEAEAGGLALVELGLILRAREVVHRRPVPRLVGAEDDVEVELAVGAEAVNPLDLVAGRDGVIDGELVIGGRDAVACDLRRAPGVIGQDCRRRA